MCGSLNSYVATLTNFVPIEFLCSFFKLVLRPSFYVATAFLFWFLLQHCFLYYHNFRRDPESLSRQSFIATLPDFLLQLHFGVATWPLGVVDVCCRDPVCYVMTRLFCFQLIFVSRPSLLCRDQTSLPCVGIFFAT